MATVLDRAAGVVANSAHTLGTLAEFAAGRGCAVPPAAVAWPWMPLLKRVPESEAREPTFVIFGAIEGRKKPCAAAVAVAPDDRRRQQRSVPWLVFVSRRGWEAQDVFAELDGGAFGDPVSEVGALDD